MTRNDAASAEADCLAIFGRNVRAERERAGLKQVELGERIGVGQQRIALIESGKQNVTLRTMASLAVALGCDLPGMLIEQNGDGPGVRLRPIQP